MNPKPKNIYKCSGCSRELITPEKLECAKCDLVYHYYECVNLGKKRFLELSKQQKTSWICPACQSKPPRGDNSDTPVRGLPTSGEENSDKSNVTIRRVIPSASTVSALPSTVFTLESIRHLIQEASDDLLAKLEKRLTVLMETKTKEIFEEISGLKNSLNYMSQEQDDLKKELKIRCEEIKELSRENMQMRVKLTDFNSRINVMEQYSRTSNVEIQCVPEYKTENLENIVVQLGAVTGSEI
ncbi:unnamed protein product [Chilo suppressalis]|uniref:Zinc finger PHD-type domain-containing protein n=1 Tax=Chilo suppressalis TaxID=168631 RepID=A0ABN8APE7_CHISP|nr:unnamed protein product [Chilo suppressalis]